MKNDIKNILKIDINTGFWRVFFVYFILLQICLGVLLCFLERYDTFSSREYRNMFYFCRNTLFFSVLIFSYYQTLKYNKNQKIKKILYYFLWFYTLVSIFLYYTTLPGNIPIVFLGYYLASFFCPECYNTISNFKNMIMMLIKAYSSLP